MNVGLHKEEYERTNALSSAAVVGGRLRRTVRPEGQKRGAAKLEDRRGPGKSAAARKLCNAARMIAGDTCSKCARGKNV